MKKKAEKVSIKSYNEAEIFLANKESRKICNNTYVVKLHNAIGIKYHDSIIVKYHNNKCFISIYNDWYYTKSTKNRINTFIPIIYKLFQRNFRWHIRTGKYKESIFINGMFLNVGDPFAVNGIIYPEKKLV